MGYEYKPEEPSAKKKVRELFGNESQKKIYVASAVILAIIIVYGAGSSYTGYVTYARSVQTQLNETGQKLSNAVTERDACSSALGNTITSLDNCNTRLADSSSDLTSCEESGKNIQADYDRLSTLVSSCRSEKESAETKYKDAVNEINTLEEAYNRLAVTSAQGMCCTLGDIQGGATRQWSINANSIICVNEGGYTINCGTGETNY